MIFSEDTKAGLSTSTVDVEGTLANQFSVNDEDVIKIS